MKIIDLLHSNRNEKVQEGTFPYLEISDIDVNSKKYSFKDKTSVLGAVYAHKNNILVSTVRPTRGAITIVKENEIPVSNAFAILNVNDKICLPKYLFYSINNKGFLDYLGKNSKGATYPTCSKEDIYNYIINYVDYSRQNEIVTTFDNISRQIEIKTNQLSDYDQLIKSRFVEMFGDSPLLYKFDDVIVDETKFGYKYDSSFYYKHGEVAIVDQGKNLICGFKSYELGKKPYENECIIFGDHTEIFKHITFPIYLGADGTKILKILKGWNTRFIHEFLGIHYHKIGGYSRHFKYLKNQMFSKPDISKQIEFTQFCKQVDKLKFAVQQSLNETQQLFDSLMQEYFRQEVN